VTFAPSLMPINKVPKFDLFFLMEGNYFYHGGMKVVSKAEGRRFFRN
jgi:hypothetical protein